MSDGGRPTQGRRKQVARLAGKSEKHMQREPRELIGPSPCQWLYGRVRMAGKKLSVTMEYSYVSSVPNW